MFHNNVFCVLVVVCWLNSMSESGVVERTKSLKSYMTGGYKPSEMHNSESELDCSQFIDDYDILRKFPVPIKVNLAVDDEQECCKTIAIMDENDTFVSRLSIYKENVVPWSVYCFSNLDTFEVDRTPFENNIVPDAITNFKKLRYFLVYDSPIVKLTEKIGTLDTLTFVMMRNCSLTHMPNITNLEKVWSLDLRNNRLSHLNGIPPDLKFLDLPGNFFNYIPIMKNGEELMFLTMSNNPLKTIAPIMFYKNLEGIDFENTMLTSIPPAIDQLRKLQYINLSNNKLSHIPTNILNLPLLEQVNISKNLLSQNEIQSIRKEFEKSHPKLELIV
jgi:Leucine-rich repeat (LRR) protein